MDPGAGGSARFAKFETPEAGIAAADRQLMFSYQSVSADDTWDVMTLSGEALEVGAVNAADMGHDDTYRDLIALHNTVVSMLTERVANLARFTEYQFDTALPSLVLSERIYQDPARNNELVRCVNPVHPEFMPLDFKALSK